MVSKLSLSIIALAIFIGICIAGSVSAVGTYPAVDPSMVLYYHFNNQSAVGENATHVYDWSNGHVNNGTATNGVSQINGEGILLDGAKSFDGADDYIAIYNSPTSSLNQSFSRLFISFWVKPNVTNFESSNGYVLDKRNHFIFYIINSTGIISLDTTGLSDTSISSVTPLQTNVWTHVVFSYDGSSKRLYINGRLDKAETSVTGNVYSSGTTYNLNVGGRDVSNNFKGMIDEIIISNQSMTAKQVWELYYLYLGCYTPLLNDAIMGDTNVCQGNYNLNSSLASPIFSIGNDNIIFDCNYSLFYGNYSGSGTYRGLQVSGFNNVTFKNCYLKNYFIDLYARHSVNVSLSNMVCSESSSCLDYQNVTGGYIFNVSSYNSSLIVGESNSRNLYFNKLYCDFANDSSCFEMPNSIGLRLNDFYFSRSARAYFTNATNLNVTNGIIYNTLGTYGRGIQINAGSNNVLIQNVTISDTDMAIYLANSTNVFIRNSTFENMTKNTDYYDVGIHVEYNSSNIQILDNNFTDFGSTGILFRQTFNSVIARNSFKNTPNVLLGNYDCTMVAGNQICNSEPVTAIFIEQIYKGFIPVGTSAWYNYTQASRYSSNNITLDDNEFNNIPVLLRTQGTTNLVHDLISWWFRSFRLPYYTDLDSFWISNDWNNASSINGNKYDPILYQGIYTNFSINYSLTRNYEFYKCINPVCREIQRFNSTNALFHNSTSICNGASSNIASNDGNVNITLQPNEVCYVLDNFNLTEGVSRENSPISFSQVSNLSKSVYSTLTQPINVSVEFVVTGCEDRLGFISSQYQTRAPGDYVCSDNRVTLQDVLIGPGTTTFNIQYGYVEFLQPLDLESTFVDTLAGSKKIFLLIMFIVVASLAGYFRMPNIVSLVMFGLMILFMAALSPGFYLLFILMVSIIISYSVGRLIKS